MIELLIVIGLIGFLAAALVTVVPLVMDGSRKSGTTATLGRLKMALQNYKSEFGYYPQAKGFTDPLDTGLYAYLADTGTLYCLWHGYGRNATGWGTYTDMKAPLPGQMKTPQGKLVGFLQDKDLSFSEGDTYKRWPLDSWQRPILYAVWRPDVATSPYDPYCVLISKGSDEDDQRDDIIVKGNE